MRLLMADRYIKTPIGVLYDVLVKVNQFILPAEFVILDCEIYHEVLIILGKTLLATEKALGYIKNIEMRFWVNNAEVFFNVYNSMK